MGLAGIHADPEGGLSFVSLTPRGKAALADLEAGTIRDLARLTDKLGDEEALALSDALKRVTRLLEKS
ncbi:hypothetical protein [Mesorhizobium sp. WSM4884]|uniref:hypothetical protein n=1 Tax=Mesorhizobium sp. WSM4884 TaxID=3038542 RepID=UPI0024162E39|nr:hypothetical protein [Mesorhizobium sp. WSM4884]MDG4885200.1 hypothetical protein [Mesorhizobium sp. WSM4884]